MHIIDTLALLGAAMVLAKLLGGLFSKVGIPTVLAELLTGIVIGNIGGAFVHLESSEVVKTLSEIGVMLLLFIVGLETDIREIGKVGKESSFAAIYGVVVPSVLAFLIVPLVSETNFNHTLFMATALTATSVGITARVLQDILQLRTVSGRIILGAAVIDDILGIIILTVVTAIVTQGSISGPALMLIFGKVALFMVGVVALRHFVLPRIFLRLRPLEVSGTITVFLFGAVFGLAWVAESAGLAGIIGAFALGVALDDVHFEGYFQKRNLKLEEIIQPAAEFFIPIFFIFTGMSVKMEALLNPDALVLAGVLIAIGIIGKLVCGLALSRKSVEAGGDRLLVGYGMIPRGEVGLIFAAMGLSLGILNRADYGAVVMMVAVTTFLAPILLAMRAKRLKQKGA